MEILGDFYWAIVAALLVETVKAWYRQVKR
jgi:hypothetical protein